MTYDWSGETIRNKRLERLMIAALIALSFVAIGILVL